MGGFFRKVAGAFIYLEDDAKGQVPALENTQLDQIELESAELLNQLGPSRLTAAEPAAVGTQPETVPVSASASIMEMTADQVFVAAALADTPNSAQRVLKLIAGLAMFPKEQQVVMLRAMDAADDAWSEREVLEDARRRQASLRNHVQAIEAEKQERLQRVAANAEAANAESQRALADIDRQMNELQQLREQTIARATTELSELEHQRKSVEESAERARRGITSVINAFSELITFFTGTDPKTAGKS